jgi:hypothetical protein
MDAISTIKIGLTGFSIVGISYACIGTGFLQNSESGWWNTLPKQKKNIFIAAIAATVLQTFL